MAPCYGASGPSIKVSQGPQTPSLCLPTSAALQNLLKRFEPACSAATAAAPGGSGGAATAAAAASADLELLRFCAAVVAELPYRRGDEPCSIVHQARWFFLGTCCAPPFSAFLPLPPTWSLLPRPAITGSWKPPIVCGRHHCCCTAEGWPLVHRPSRRGARAGSDSSAAPPMPPCR